MLPCKKRRVVTADSSEEETAGLNDVPDVQAVRMEVSPSAPAGDLCFFEAAGGKPTEEEAIPVSEILQKGCQKLAEASFSEGALVTVAGDNTCLDQARENQRESAELLVVEEQRLEHEAGVLSPKSGSGPLSVKTPKAAQDAEFPQEAKEDAEETGLFIPVEEREEDVGKRKRRKTAKRKRDGRCPDEESEPLACDLKLDDTLDRTLEDGAKQHNLTAVNVRNILHEVITNEHVVAMMKAAISETEDAPIFEPKMTRSKLKEVVEKGVVIPTWNISPIKKANETKPPQFVDIPLEEDDSSDEEYQPEEEEEDETAEESLLESDIESAASSPHGAKRSRPRQSDLAEADEEGATPTEAEKAAAVPLQRHISAEVVPMGPPPPPKPKQNKDSAFMEKLHAVDEELASSPVCMDTYQPLEDSLIAFRTRSKRPLKDVPLGQLEAELQAPDITPDMYDPNTADDEEWKRWLGGLMNDDVENEDEADDDDDPEYNFLEDLDEPDTEDFRNDRAVRITKKEVNELMEELFETFQDEMGFSNVEDEGPEDEDNSAEARPNFNTPQVLRFEEPLANLLNEQHRTVKEQLKQLRMKKSAAKLPTEAERAKVRDKPVQALALDTGQRKRLQQQMQQHVQLLTQIHLLSSSNPGLSDEASTTRLFLEELHTFAQGSTAFRQTFSQKFQTTFQPCNLKEALQLLEDFHAHVKVESSPRKPMKKNVNDFASLPKQVAWILATRRVFMYPELLPTCSLKAKTPQDKIVFTKGEDNLLALGLKHFEGTEFPKPLISKYLLTTKTAHQLTVRIKNLNMKRIPNNILKHYKMTKELPVLSKFCEEIEPDDWKLPLEQEEHRLPFWLKASLPSIQEWLAQRPAQEASGHPGPDPHPSQAGQDLVSPVNGEKYPLHVPEGLQLILRSRLCWKAWKCKRTAAAKPLPVRTGLGLPPAGTGNFLKVAASQSQLEAPAGKAPGRVPLLIQPALPVQPLPGIHSLSLQPAVRTGAGFELQGVLPAPQSGSRAGIAPSVPRTLVSPLPVAFQASMMLPALPVPRPRRPGAAKASQKKKSPKAAPLIKAAPLLQPAPVIFTVPAGAVKVVSLANGCNVLQPLATAAAGGARQPIPITTLLVNPAPFPCSLSRPLAAPALAAPVLASPPAPPVMVAASSTSSAPLSAALPEPSFVSQPAAQILCPVEAEPGRELQSPPLGSAASVTQNCAQWSSDLGPGAKEKPPASACVEMAEEKAPELGPFPSSVAELGDLAEAGLEDPVRDPEVSAGPEMPSAGAVSVPEELVLELGQELDVQPALECVSEPKDAPYKPSAGQNQGSAPGAAGQPAAETTAAGAEGAGGSPMDIGASAVGKPAPSGPLARPEDSSGAGSSAAATPAAGPEAAGEKDTPEEEEEEEDFDDLTQDEEDEEMSSASEESVLSVPELQETMEKLTWLASERRLSQEGDSEEENSQEENSEPEEEEEEEEEGEGETLENVPKEDEIVDEAACAGERPASSPTSASAAPEAEPSQTPSGENHKAPGRNRGSHRVRAKRGRARASKDTSKLLLLYDEDILERDPLREQKDLAFAQAYLSRVRDALQHIPGKYEEFLHIIYEFESSTERQTAVDLYARLQDLLRQWPQLLSDFAAFLLPEQALECGLFEEQQAFEKSRKFLRQLEICFAENPSHHQKIIKVLQSCAECLPQEIIELKTQMWQLLKGHDHLQDEFSIFFDHLRPSANRLGDFEEINWTEEKEYEFDGFEEVSLPEVEEDEDPPKIHASTKNKKRKELGGQNADKEPEWAEAAKECSCSCHEGSGDLRMKRSKRKSCSHCSNKAGDGKSCRNKEPQDLSPRPEGKEAAEEPSEPREDGEPPQSKARTAGGGPCLEGRLPLPHETSLEGAAALEPGPPCPKKAGDAAKTPPLGGVASPPPQPPKGPPSKQPHRLKGGPCPAAREGESGSGPRSGETPPGLHKATWTAEASVGGAGGGARPPPPARTGATKPPAESSPSEEPVPCVLPCLRTKEGNGLPAAADPAPEGKGTRGSPAMDLGLKADGTNCGFPPPAEPPDASGSPIPAADPKGSAPEARDSFRPQLQLPGAGGGERAFSWRGEEPHPRAAEATVCAKNIKVSSTGEKVVLWTREADRVILTTCQEQGAHPDTFNAISQQLRNKTAEEVAHRFRELMTLFHTACDVSSEDEEDGMSTSNTDQLSDEEPEQDDHTF